MIDRSPALVGEQNIPKMKNVKITVKGKQVPLSFGYGSQKRLGDFLGQDTYDGTAQKVAAAIQALADQEKENGKLPFDILDTLGFMILAAAGNDADFEMDDAVDAIFQDMEKVKDVVEAWADSMPKPKKGAEPQKKRTANRKK